VTTHCVEVQISFELLRQWLHQYDSPIALRTASTASSSGRRMVELTQATIHEFRSDFPDGPTLATYWRTEYEWEDA